MRIIHWGMIGYADALKRQKGLLTDVAAGAMSVVATCEHPCTLTLGRTHHEKNLLLSREELIGRGFGVFPADRGGDVTLHAPGQLVAYPVMDLKTYGRDIGAYLRKLEQASVDFLKEFGIVAQGDNDRRGVWVGREKIASIGIGVSRWVTYHGLSLNISTDLDLYKVIRPCGLDVQMTSIKKLTGRAPSMPDVANLFADRFLKVFND